MGDPNDPIQRLIGNTSWGRLTPSTEGPAPVVPGASPQSFSPRGGDVFGPAITEEYKLRQAISSRHPDWGTAQIEQATAAMLVAGITGSQYASYGDQIDQQILGYTAPMEMEQLQTGVDEYGQYQIDPMTGQKTYISNPINPMENAYTQAQIDQMNRDYQLQQQQFAWQQQQAQREWQLQQQQMAQEQAYRQQQMEMERQANTWTTYTDASGVWKRNGLGEVVRVGDVPRGVTQNMPETWSGWGKQWQQSDVYNPETQKMDLMYQAAPMGWEASLAQAQWANQPGNWVDVGMMNRTLPGQEQKYNTYVGETVGRLVSNKPGYAQNYDLQQGQAATGITPAGWFEDWKQGYGTDKGGTGTGEGGGYQTMTAQYGDYNAWDQSAKDELSGWLGSGLSDYRQPQDYYDRMNRLRAPSGYSGVRWTR